MIQGTRALDKGIMVTQWDSNNNCKAFKCLKLIEPQFIVGVVLLDHIFGPLKILTKKLQERELDIDKAYEMSKDVIERHV